MESSDRSYSKDFLIWIVLLALLLLSRVYNYLLFHNIAEIFSIVVACSIFILAWNSREFMNNDFLLFLGTAFLFIAGVDFVHTLAYYGMGVFQGYDRDLPTQLWIIGRYIQALSFLVAPFFFTKRLNFRLVVVVFALVTLILLALTFSGYFPACFKEGTGLTLFKKMSEYVICMMLLVSIYLLRQKRSALDSGIFFLVIASIAVTIVSEMAFSLYTDVYGISNMIGHYLKIVAFYLIYKAIIEAGLRKPHSLLFRDLKLREQELEKVLSEVKTLRGIIPICASCKKIRDDQGYWHQVEKYVKDRSDADFSHGICPDCAVKLYPEFYKKDL